MFKDFQIFLQAVLNHFNLIMTNDRKTGFKFFVSRDDMISILSHIEDTLVHIRNLISETHKSQLVFKNDLYGEIVEVPYSETMHV